ncbi:extracellular solute-binding protein [Paenibacillus sp. N3.4]|uniref:extracellular solute-binding protein n=1 Tax=Paenibacillus sp. N3.4 TaxID=2603222 RepID=UPI0011CBEE8C|nr:extracellular solute-binding protein [Paenibacillus sp. N3.4]TXK77638.1 extracellular solute-binding protein [Paenibacillus sp. N3.4]
MKSKGYLAAGCSVALLGSLLAGCTGGTPTKNEGVGSKVVDTGTKAADDTKKANPLNVTWMRYEHPSQPLVANSVVVQEILKRKNIKLEIQSTPQSNYDDKKKTLIATNTLPDVLLVKQDDISNFADTGVFLDLTKYMDKMPNFKKIIADNPEINKNKIDGKLYGFPLTQR